MRNYSPLVAAAKLANPPTPGQSMSKAVELLWQAFPHDPISWVGFYLRTGDSDEMTLVCREPKPACSPIGLHGMCGRSCLTRRSILVADVRTLGANYIACDPKDQSEIVIPLIDAQGHCPGVLDVDSYDLNAFTNTDIEGMTELLIALNLTTVAAPIDRL